MTRRKTRILSVSPTSRGFGFAVFEGRTELIDWGIKETRQKKNETALRRVSLLVKRYRPQRLVLEDLIRTRKSARVKKLLRDILELTAQQKVVTRTLTRPQMVKAFAELETETKYQIASAITLIFPELAPRLPPPRKVYFSEDGRLSLFDAVALGLTFFYFAERQRMRKERRAASSFGGSAR